MWKAVFRREDAWIEQLFDARDSKEALGKAQLLAERKGWKLLRVEEIGELKGKPKGISEEEVEAMIEEAIIEEEEEEDIIDEFEWEEEDEGYY
jgi:hypothetical protein